MTIKPENLTKRGRAAYIDQTKVASKWVQIRVTKAQQDKYKAAAQAFGDKHDIACAYTSWAKAVLDDAAARELGETAN